MLSGSESTMPSMKRCWASSCARRAPFRRRVAPGPRPRGSSPPTGRRQRREKVRAVPAAEVSHSRPVRPIDGPASRVGRRLPRRAGSRVHRSLRLPERRVRCHRPSHSGAAARCPNRSRANIPWPRYRAARPRAPREVTARAAPRGRVPRHLCEQGQRSRRAGPGRRPGRRGAAGQPSSQNGDAE